MAANVENTLIQLLTDEEPIFSSDTDYGAAVELSSDNESNIDLSSENEDCDIPDSDEWGEKYYNDLLNYLDLNLIQIILLSILTCFILVVKLILLVNITDISTWIRVYLPQNEEKPVFQVNNITRVKKCPHRNSTLMEYFYLFFTQSLWQMLMREININANRTIQNAINKK
ncbi:hypothetical protein J6590_045786 [Homalodisca vitripennis]|nr:hypothetical protein J6590_045786 [Homalodisca vitripennis]